MKFKSLFLGMLVAALFVGCNNDNPIDGDGYGPGGVNDGVSTHATFTLKLAKSGGTYAHTALDGSAQENAFQDAALFVYKIDGTPEAMIYATNTEFTTQGYSNGKITVKCKSGDKLIYLAVNLGGTSGSNTIIDHGYNGGAHADPWVGVDWEASGTNPKTFSALNTPVWSATATALSTTGAAGVTVPGVSDGLIKALINKGNPNPQGANIGFPASNDGQGYFMSNWGDANTQEVGEGGSSGYAPEDQYTSTVKFNLKANISAEDSRNATSVNKADSNALTINIQRAIAKISVAWGSNLSADPKPAGNGSNAGTFDPGTKWAIGNINTSTYPFQMFDPSTKAVKSTLYDSLGSITGPNANPDWVKELDNTRWIPGSQSYTAQNLTAKEVLTQMRTTSTINVAFGIANRALVTENNNKWTYDQYSTFIVLGGQYVPAKHVSAVSLGGVVAYTTTAPAYPSAPTASSFVDADTLYYLQSATDETNVGQGLFLHGKTVLLRYVAYKLMGKTAAPGYYPEDETDVANYVHDLRAPNGTAQAELQVYWQGNCFYRVFVRDAEGTVAANKLLVRRNHVYDITVQNILGPGIGDPNDIVTPDPENPGSVEEAETWVSVTINIMKWHIVGQDVDLIL
jgi:hypothetical protein